MTNPSKIKNIRDLVFFNTASCNLLIEPRAEEIPGFTKAHLQ